MLVQREPGIYYGQVGDLGWSRRRVGSGRSVEGAVTGPEAAPIELDRVVGSGRLGDSGENGG